MPPLARHHYLIFGLLLSVSSLTAAVVEGAIVRFQTTLGSIDVRMYDGLAPNSVANFLNYANSNRYDNTFIHRVPQLAGGGSSNFVIQGGGFKLNNSIFDATGIVTDAPIGNEFNVSNQRGTLAMAKNTLGATSQWFFNLGDNSFLDDQDFTVIGRVLGNGMDVVDAINALSTVNAEVAENADGEDFDEVPVLDLDKVVTQQNILNEDAVIVSDVSLRPLSPGDFNQNGFIDLGDLALWQADYGSTTKGETDANGDGIVNAADYTIWRDLRVASATAFATPEPSAVVLTILAAAAAMARRRA
ncbi:Peptidyl-prolyl cis-trans isomerase B [Botrimarina colliarenosi]|uniref:peptidylprolyl isomerase n=1 Tax=Botrimarina colliarenosi TaxID=2528001 RepID=A0A5C6ALK5_9BACT|nr:peptidylprolyl isomerase [Botrimarina colliarenosi]TWU00291.1 Peptidyl-prolyl cis-trans isomerase B [Botrimarina colliarenosi]